MTEQWRSQPRAMGLMRPMCVVVGVWCCALGCGPEQHQTEVGPIDTSELGDRVQGQDVRDAGEGRDVGEELSDRDVGSGVEE